MKISCCLIVLLEAMSREPANEDTRLARSGLGQTQIIRKLIGGSEEGKCGSSEARFGSSEVTKNQMQITNFKAHNL